MNPSFRFQLEVEAWQLVCKLSLRLDQEIYNTENCPLALNVYGTRSVYVKKISSLHARAYKRFLRRQSFLYD